MPPEPHLSIVADANRRVTLVVALIAAMLVGLDYLASVRDARAQLDDRADEVIVAITEAFCLPFWDHNLSNAMEIATAFPANDWVVYVRVTDAGGRPVAGVGARADAAVLRQGEVRYGERLVGRVVIGLTLRPLDKQIRQAVRNSLAMLAVVAAALGLLNRTFLRRGLQRPVSLLLDRIHRIHRIARGDDGAPGPDIRHAEVREVVRQFDAMARKVEQRERSYLDARRQLQSAQAELTRCGGQLEETVAQRTRALEDEVQVRRQTEVELLHAKQDAERADRAKSDFVAQVSHELRTPSNGILGCAQILRNDAALAAPLGFDCAEAVDGEDCLRHVAQGPLPDAVLMDVALPRLDGLEATRRLHALPGAGALPVIALSSSVGEAEREACRRAGCAAFVPKPIPVQELLDALARCLRLDRLHRAEPAAPAGARPAAAARFEPLPAARAQALREAALKGHLKGIAGQAQAIEALGEPFAAMGRQIRELARQFRFDDIAALAGP